MATNIADAIKDGTAFSWNFLSADIAIGETIGLLKRTGERNLRIHQIIMTGGNVVSLYDIHIQSASDSAVPAGTAVVAVPLNSRKNNGLAASQSVAKADETAYTTQGSILQEAPVGIVAREVIEMYDMVLAVNEAIAVDQVSESTAGGMTIIGFFE